MNEHTVTASIARLLPAIIHLTAQPTTGQRRLDIDRTGWPASGSIQLAIMRAG